MNVLDSDHISHLPPANSPPLSLNPRFYSLIVIITSLSYLLLKKKKGSKFWGEKTTKKIKNAKNPHSTQTHTYIRHFSSLPTFRPPVLPVCPYFSGNQLWRESQQNRKLLYEINQISKAFRTPHRRRIAQTTTLCMRKLPPSPDPVCLCLSEVAVPMLGKDTPPSWLMPGVEAKGIRLSTRGAFCPMSESFDTALAWCTLPSRVGRRGQKR